MTFVLSSRIDLVGWFKEEVLKGSLSNFWTMRPTTTNSWLTNKIFKLRDEVYTWIKMRVGNGVSCRFWSDNWSPFGKLTQYQLAGQTSHMGIGLNTTLADLCVNGNWRFPPPRSENMVQFYIFLTTFALTDEDDQYEWLVADNHSPKYNTSQVYQKLRGEELTVPWVQIVWISGGIPR